MMNEIYKKAFIDMMNITDDKYRQLVESYFEKAAKYEEGKQKDLCNFSVTEIEELYKSFFSRSLEGLQNINYLYVKYTRYMLSQNLVSDSQNHYEEFDVDLLSKCLSSLGNTEIIITRERLCSDIKDLENACDQFLVLAIFEGISGAQYMDFNQLRMSDFKNGKVYLPNNRVLSVSDKLIELAELSANEYVYYVYNMENAAVPTRNFNKDDDRIIKSVRKDEMKISNPLNRQRIYSKIVRIKNYFNCNAYTLKGLIESGRIDMLKRYMKSENISSVKRLLSERKDIRDLMIIRYGDITNNSINNYLIKYGKYYEGN